VTAAYALAMAVGLLTGGRLGDIFGRRRVLLAGMTGFVLTSARVLLAGMTGFVLTSAACAAAQSAGELIAGRGLAEVGEGAGEGSGELVDMLRAER
jgi:MFS family permease